MQIHRCCPDLPSPHLPTVVVNIGRREQMDSRVEDPSGLVKLLFDRGVAIEPGPSHRRLLGHI
jgi:hypothetical protein